MWNMGKKLFVALSLVFVSVSLTGCPGGFQTVHPAATENAAALKADPVKTVRNLIDESNAAIAAATQTIYDDVAAGVYSKATGHKLWAQLQGFAADIDVADELLAAGKTGEAFDKTKIVKVAIDLLTTQLVKLEQKGTK